MTLYVIPSFCAILIKAWLLWSEQFRFKANGALVLLLGALLVLNLIEFCSFFVLDRPLEVICLMHGYYFTAAFAAAAILNLFLCLTGNAANHLTKFNWALATVICVMSLAPGVVIAGVENIGYSFTRIPGSFYMVWPVYIVSALIFGVVLLLRGYKSSKDLLQRRRCLAILIGLLPIICSTIGIIFLMVAGVKINATVVLSSAIVFFLVALIYSEQRYGLFKILASVPFTEEYALRNELATLIRKIESSAFDNTDGPSFKAHIKRIESLYVDLAILANGGNKTHAAASLGISSATLHRKATRKRQQHVAQPVARAKAQAIDFTPSRM